MKSLFCLILMISGIATATAQPLDSLVTKRMKDWHIPGLAIAVIKDGNVVSKQCYGLANLETKTPVSDSSVFITASLSKQFIATAILVLRKEGNLSLEESIAHYFDSLPVSWQHITIRQLLTHTAGFERDPSDYHPYTQQTLMRVIDDMHDIPLRTKPGEGYWYSNAGYFLLAEIITRSSGKDWKEFLRDRVFLPAGLMHTRVLSSREVITNRVSGYHWSDTAFINAENWLAVRPSGSVASTIDDLVKWDLCLSNGKLLSAADREILWTTPILNNGERSGYGLGWAVDSFLNHPRIHHDGQYPGFRADYERFAEDGLTVIILANGDNASVESLALKTAGLFTPGLQFPVFTVKVNPSDHYVTKQPGEIAFTVSNNAQLSPVTTLEMEIWDEKGRPVYKENKQKEPFGYNETRSFLFHWTPALQGVYTINIGIYGPRWMPDFSWNVKLATIKVE